VRLTSIRDYLGSDCTQGILTLESGFTAGPWQTIEPPWIPTPHAPCGLKGQSCFPEGEYKLVRHDTEAHPRTWALVNPDLWVYHWDEDVPAGRVGLARTVCLLHPANFARELKGCCAPGMVRDLDDASGRKMVKRSAEAMRQIQAAIPWDDSHTLLVTRAQ
jgi:hypothetical protein